MFKLTPENKSNLRDLDAEVIKSGLINHPDMLAAYLEGAAIQKYLKLVDCWVNDLNPTFESGLAYRVKPPFYSWTLIDERFKYIAKDENGRWSAYYKKPKIGTYAWFGSHDDVTDEIGHLFPDSLEWEYSLMERP